jgi:hypothetical protein
LAIIHGYEPIWGHDFINVEKWVLEQISLVLWVPSTVVGKEYNYMKPIPD